MILPHISPDEPIQKGDKILLQRTPDNESRIPMFMDMQWATVRGFNTHGNIIIWYDKESGDCGRWSRRRSVRREDIVYVKRKEL